MMTSSLFLRSGVDAIKKSFESEGAVDMWAIGYGSDSEQHMVYSWCRTLYQRATSIYEFPRHGEGVENLCDIFNDCILSLIP